MATSFFSQVNEERKKSILLSEKHNEELRQLRDDLNGQIDQVSVLIKLRGVDFLVTFSFLRGGLR
jgi:hypothetical protein